MKCKPQADLTLAVEIDVADSSSVEALVSAVNAQFGRIDILLNNAAIGALFL
jgi:NAD(P)-dependent dehydrogenase (short-subunit alcohol dehydrogenase family)